jgi:hypothetical protein
VFPLLFAAGVLTTSAVAATDEWPVVIGWYFKGSGGWAKAQGKCDAKNERQGYGARSKGQEGKNWKQSARDVSSETRIKGEMKV